MTYRTITGRGSRGRPIGKLRTIDEARREVARCAASSSRVPYECTGSGVSCVFQTPISGHFSTKTAATKRCHSESSRVMI